MPTISVRTYLDDTFLGQKHILWLQISEDKTATEQNIDWDESGIVKAILCYTVALSLQLASLMSRPYFMNSLFSKATLAAQSLVSLDSLR